MKICGKGVRIDGRVIRIGRLEADRYEFLDDPEAACKEIRDSGVRMDLFTFLQRLRDRHKKYTYPMERDNLAALPVSTFDHWWTKQIDGKTRNMLDTDKPIVISSVPFTKRRATHAQLWMLGELTH